LRIEISFIQEKDLIGETISDLSNLETYCEETFASLLYLTLECLGIRSLHADHAASHIGKAVGICSLLRATPYHLRRRQCYLPRNLLSKHNLSPEELFLVGDSNLNSKLEMIAFEVAEIARAHLKTARELSKNVPQEAFPALHSSAIAEDLLARFQSSQFNLFSPHLTRRNINFPFQLAKNWMLNRY